MTYKTIGILGGGQLGRMSAQAAQKLGLSVVIFTPEDECPAAEVACETLVGAYDDHAALKAFSEKVDVITYEFENIPVETVRYLKQFKPVYPDDNILEIAQDRIREKSYLNQIGIPTTRWAPVNNEADVDTILKDLNAKALILKTTRFGYDGKGQVRVQAGDDIRNALDQLNSNGIIAEEIIDFQCEISVIVSRGANGETELYGPMLNKHKNHILHSTTIPAGISEKLARAALEMTQKLAEQVGLRGVLALEMFVTRDGRILANEIAPRTHNSGHWTIDACAISQFENHVRAVCGMPVAQQNRHSDAEMINLIGDDILHIGQYEAQKNACVHTYGKHDIKPGRKMGHVTILTPLTPETKP